MEHLALARILKFLPGIILGLTVHEFSHAFIASKCGDFTSKEQGRVSLNPLRHIDLMGFLMLLVAGFGWAKPVQFNEQNLRNPRIDVMKIAVSGPISNALLAMLLSFILILVDGVNQTGYNSMHQTLKEVILYAVYINWGLFVFNLIPLPPLDGSHLLLSQFRKFPVFSDALYKYGSWLFFILIIVTVFTEINLLPIWPVIQFLGEGFLSLIDFR